MKTDKEKTVSRLLMLLVAIIGLQISSCNRELDTESDYNFKVSALPVPYEVATGTKIEFRLTLSPDRKVDGQNYSLRYFLPKGIGSVYLKDEKLLVNDRYRVERGDFRLYYTPMSKGQHTLDLYFEDNSGHIQTMRFSFDVKAVTSVPEGTPESETSSDNTGESIHMDTEYSNSGNNSNTSNLTGGNNESGTVSTNTGTAGSGISGNNSNIGDGSSGSISGPWTPSSGETGKENNGNGGTSIPDLGNPTGNDNKSASEGSGYEPPRGSGYWTMNLFPVKSSLKVLEPVSIKFELQAKELEKDRKLTIRFFQSKGIGKLFSAEKELQPNTRYTIRPGEFVLNFICTTDDPFQLYPNQIIQFVIEDNYLQKQTLDLTFNAND